MAKPTFDGRVLLEENGLLYSIANKDRRAQMVAVLSESFCREPMGLALGVSARDLAPLIERFMPECTNNGLSVIVVPEDEPQTVSLHMPRLQVPSTGGGSRRILLVPSDR